MQKPPQHPEPLITLTASLEEWQAIEKLIVIYRKQCKAMRYESPMLGILDRFEEKLTQATKGEESSCHNSLN